MADSENRIRSGLKAPRQQSNSATVRDVARLAQVSAITVSRTLRDPSKVAESTRLRVQSAISVTGYVPNLMAGGLKSSRTNLIVALVPTTSGPLFSEMMQSLTESLDGSGFQVLFGEIGYKAAREDRLLRSVMGRRPDGILLTGVVHPGDTAQLLRRSGIPVVEAWDWTDDPIDMLVGLSHRDIGTEVCSYLLSKGHRRVGVITGDDERAAKRVEGFVDQASRSGVPAPAICTVSSPTSHSHGRQKMSDLLGGFPGVDAVFCSSDILALGCLDEARSRGISVPEELAVVGLGDLDFSASTVPALTTVRIDGSLIGRAAADMFIARANNNAPHSMSVNVGFDLIIRETA